jgi:peptide/nickel transport system substrate-binding protein
MKRMFAVLMVVSFAFGLSGCTQGGGGSAGKRDQLSIALPINPQLLNPILTQNAIENFVAGLMFSLLVTRDVEGNQVPDLAAQVPTLQNGGISKDGLTITYHLRKNAKWHDGVPVTSKDVKFTWQAIMNPANNVVSHTGYNQVASIDTPDQYTVVMHMKKPYPPAVDTIFGESDTPFRILPEHVLSKFPNLNQVPFNAAPVGTGPYKFARWLRGDRIVLIANDQYFKGAPKIKELVLKIIPDANTTESQIRTGEVDLGLQIIGPVYNSLKSDPKVVAQLAEAPSYIALMLNNKRPPLNDLRVRKAIALALDRDTIVRTQTYGTGKVAIADLAPFSWAFDASLKPLPFDPAQSKALLAQAGWSPGPDGILVKNGQRLSLQLAYGQGSALARNVSVEAQQMLKAAGIAIDLKSYDYAVFYAAAQNGGILNGGKYDMAFYSWVSGSDPDNSSAWTCPYVPPYGNNVSRYCSTAMDAMQQDALSTFDRSKRKAAYSKIERQLLDDVPAVFFYYQPLRYAHIPQLQHFTPNGISEGWNAQEWNR